MPKLRSKRSPFVEGINGKIDSFYFVYPNGKCPVEDDFLNDPQIVAKSKKAKIAALMRRYAEQGEITFDQRCHRLKGRVRDFWVFKAHQHRLYFFKEGTHRIIITHVFLKKTDKLRPEEEDRMLSIYATYNNAGLYK
jgi:phage-related protein